MQNNLVITFGKACFLPQMCIWLCFTSTFSYSYEVGTHLGELWPYTENWAQKYGAGAPSKVDTLYKTTILAHMYTHLMHRTSAWSDTPVERRISTQPIFLNTHIHRKHGRNEWATSRWWWSWLVLPPTKRRLTSKATPTLSHISFRQLLMFVCLVCCSQPMSVWATISNMSLWIILFSSMSPSPPSSYDHSGRTALNRLLH